MKRNITRIIIGACLALCVIAGMTFSPVSAQKETDFQSTSGGGRLDGTWNVELTARNCTTGAPIRTLPETNTFMFGGTMVNTTTRQVSFAPRAGVSVI